MAASSQKLEMDNLILREGTNDAKILGTSTKHYAALWEEIEESFVALDCGAHIGVFTQLAFQHGAETVIAIEPERENFRLLHRNTEGFNTVLLNAAVSDVGLLPRLDLLNIHSTNFAVHRLGRANWARRQQRVIVFSLQQLMERLKPDVVKFDIEGSEFQCKLQFPDEVRRVAIEMHPYQGESTKALHKRILQQGFGAVKNITPYLDNGHCVVAIYRR